MFVANLFVFWAALAFAQTEEIKLQTRSRVETAPGSGEFKTVHQTLAWDPKKTAIVICDMWDAHWCKGATDRVAEMAPVMNEVVAAARAQGVFIIHAPSETMEFYKSSPQRKRAQEAPPAEPPSKIERWRRVDREKEGAFPIDDSDGGCDDHPQCKGGPPYPWKRQIATIQVAEPDAVTDNGQEAFNLMQQRGIDNVIVMGVHANMCVLGRSFAIRQMVLLGKQVVLMRDMTDTMYNSRMRPFVNHFQGTDLVVEHIEKYWGPSITSTTFTGRPPFRFKEDTGPIKDARDLAANPQVREHIEKFTARGQTVELGSKPLTAVESLQRFKLPDDLQISLAVGEPDVRQPLHISFDERGRMWVVQYLQYPFPAGLKIVKYDEHLRAVFDKVPPPPPNHFRGADKVTIYEDKDRDGYFESHKDFVTGLNIATSAMPGRGGVWILNPPYLLFYPDKNHDDIPDGPPEVHLEGFGIEDTHAVANSLIWGPDGWLYGAQGSTCTATIRGIRFLGQAIWRYHPETRAFEVFAEGGGNTFHVEFDRKGRAYSGTNWGNQRGLYFVQGGYFVKGFAKHGPLTNPYSFGYFPHMAHEGDQARFSHAFIIEEGGALPERYFGKMFALVPLQNRVQLADLIPDGSTYRTLDTERVVQTEDKWFRPVDIKTGPDGAIYVADWYDIRLTHVDPRDNWDRSNGRIYRIVAKGAPQVGAFDLAKLSSEELVGYLSHSNKWFRQQALRLFADRRDSTVVPKLSELVRSGESRLALEALWALNLSGGFDESLALQQLSHPDEHVRRWTVRLLGDSRVISSRVRERLVELARSEPAVQVRSQLASSAKRFPAKDSLPIVSELLARAEDLNDPHLPLLLWWAIEDKAITDREQVLALLNRPEAWQRPLIATHIMHRLAQRYAAEGTEAALETAAALMMGAPGKAERARLLGAVAEAFKGRQPGIIPAALREAIASVGGKSDPSLVLLKLRLGAAGAEEMALALGILRNDDEKVKARRMEFIQALGEAATPEAMGPLMEAARTSRWHSVRRSALQALQRYNDPQIGRDIVAAYAKLPEDQGVRAQAIDLLSKRPEWSLPLLQAVQAKMIPQKDIPFEIIERLKLHTNAEIAALVQKLWGTTRKTPDELRNRMADVAKIVVGNSGVALRGKELFGASCAACHKLHGEGQAIGPDLTGYERDNLDFLLLAIVDPNAAIREEFTNYQLETHDGLLLTGYLLEQNPASVTMEDGEGGRVTVPRTRIKSLQASAASRMPEGLLDGMTEEQVRDLFAYLRSARPLADASK